MSLRYVSALWDLHSLTCFKLFPGLIYRMLKPKVVLLIFVSGKIVLTGAKVKILVISSRVSDSWIIPR
jgi:hypothetical protein